MAEASSTEEVITLRIRFKSETLERFIERYAADLTQNEIFIRTRDPLPVSTPLALDFSLNDGSPLLSGRGSVAWTRGPELTREAPSGMGIRFDGLTGPSKEMLTKILEAKARLANNQPAFPPPAAPERPAAPARPTPARPPEARQPEARSPETRPMDARADLPAPVSPTSERATLGRSTRSARISGSMPTASASVPVRPTPPTGTPFGGRPAAARPAASTGNTRPARPAFTDEDAEPTELANLPPTFFYEGEDADQEKTRLQDPRASAELLRNTIPRPEPEETSGVEVDVDADAADDSDDDDLTNPLAKASAFGVPQRPMPPRPDPTPPPPSAFTLPSPPANDWTTPPRSGRPERRTPPSSPSFGGLNATRESPRIIQPPSLDDNKTDHHPLILSSSTAPLPVDPGTGWRPPPPLPGAGNAGSTAALSPPPQHYQDRDPFPARGPTPPVTSPAPEPRWGGQLDNMNTAPEPRWGVGALETMNTSPALPSINPPDAPEDHALTAPAWPVPAHDPGAHMTMEEPLPEEEAAARGSSLKTWLALTVAAGALIAAALLLLPMLFKAAPTASGPGPAPAAQPEQPAAGPAEGAGAATPPAPAAAAPGAGAGQGAGKEAAPGQPAGEEPAREAAAQAAADPARGAAGPSGAAPAPAAAAPPPAAVPPVVAGDPRDRASSRTPVRPGTGRGARRSVRDVIAAADARERAVEVAPAPGEQQQQQQQPASEPKAAAPPAAVPGEGGSEDVYWLTVRSIPSGADVLIDGQVEGQTPFVRRIFDPTRSYALTVRRAGFEPHDRTLSTSDVWTKRGNVRTLTVVAKLTPAAGLPTQNDPAGRGEPNAPAPSDPPNMAPPPVEPDRKTNPFAEPAAPGGTQPQ